MRRHTIPVRIFRSAQKYIAECIDPPITVEGDTLDQAAESVREAIALRLDQQPSAALDPDIVATVDLGPVPRFERSGDTH
jgi:hypothetical protein